MPLLYRSNSVPILFSLCSKQNFWEWFGSNTILILFRVCFFPIPTIIQVFSYSIMFRFNLYFVLIGLSKVCAEHSEHYQRCFFLSLSSPRVTFLPVILYGLTKIRGPPSLQTMQVLANKGGIFKSCLRVLKLLKGLGRSLNATLSAWAPKHFFLCQCRDERTCKLAQIGS
jgi:hypothetical protein